MFDKKVLNIYCFIVGLFFIISGAGKVVDTTAFGNLIYEYGLGYLMILAPLIAVAEIMVGLCLILLINPKRYSLAAFILLTLFTIAFAYGHFTHGVNDCGCFGTLKHSKIPPLFTFLRNFILMLMCLFVFLKYPKEKTETVSWKKILVPVIMYPAIFIAGFSFTTPAFLQHPAAKHPFQGRNINETELAKYIKTSPDSSYLVFCFSYTCPHCWNSIENLRQYERTNTVDSVITFAVGQDNDKISFIQNFQPDFHIEDISLYSMSKITDIVPTAFYIEHDTIKTIIQSVLPSPITFKEHHKTLNSL